MKQVGSFCDVLYLLLGSGLAEWGVTVLSRFFFSYANWAGIFITEKAKIVPQLSVEKLVTAVSLFVDKTTYDHELRLTLCAFVEVTHIL